MLIALPEEVSEAADFNFMFLHVELLPVPEE